MSGLSQLIWALDPPAANQTTLLPDFERFEEGSQ